MRLRSCRTVLAALLISASIAGLNAQLAPVAHVARRARTGINYFAAQAAAPAVPRILIKLRPALSDPVEAALSPQLMTLRAGGTMPAQISAFMARYSIRTLTPLYSDLASVRKQRQVPATQLAAEVRTRYPNRTSRLHTPFAPPDLSRTYVIEVSGTSTDFARTLAALKADPNLEYAEEDKLISVELTPNDPYFSSSGSWGQAYGDLWGLHKINASSAWDKSTGAGVLVAVVDTGVDYNHPDIAANVVPGRDFVGASTGNPQQADDPMDHFGHGTHVAGTIAAVGNNDSGVIGVAWQAKVMPVRALDDNGQGLDSTLAAAVKYAADNGADVINASWGGSGSSQTIADAVSYAYSMGVVFVASAGNDSDNADNFYPAAYWNVITVAASDPDDQLASFSNWGSKIDVAAPGVDILSLRAAGTSMGTPFYDGYTRANGTSMAAPHVSGLAALILSAHPEYSNEDVRQAIRVSAGTAGQKGFDSNFGYGRVDAAAALAVTGALEAKISNPADGITAQTAITITGVARGIDFASYKLEYGFGPQPANWTTFQTAATPISGELGTFDPTAVPDGTYFIRLTVYSVAGQAFVDQIQVTAAAVAITTPVPPVFPTSASTYKPGLIPIAGTATAVGFQNFEIAWARGIAPASGWQTTGVTLVNGGAQALTNAVLARWDTSSITQADYYTIQLTVTAAGFRSVATTAVYLQPDLLSGNWPQWVDPGPDIMGSGLVPAQNADGSTRLILNSRSCNEVWTFPLDGPPKRSGVGGHPDACQPAVAALNGGQTEDAVAPATAGVSLVGQDGEVYKIFPAPNASIVAAPVIAHLNGGSEWDVLAFGQNAQDQQTGYVFAWKPDGTAASSNFPIQIPGPKPLLDHPSPVRTLVGDIDGDGNNEIVVLQVLSSSLTGATFTLGLFRSDGTPRTWNVPVLDGVPTAMAAADLDNNGKLEIIVASVLGDYGIFTVHVFQPDGSERAGWPVTRYDAYYPTIAVGDLNRNGRKQIVVATFPLYVFNDDGTPFSDAWPLMPSGEYGPAVIGDIDGDGSPEIVTVCKRQIISSTYRSGYANLTLLAIRRDGTIARSWQLADMRGLPIVFRATPVIGDFNHDGLTDIAVSYQVGKLGISMQPDPGVATILTTGARFNAALNDWPMIYRNPQNNPVLPASSGGISDPGSGVPGTPCTFILDYTGEFFAAAAQTALIRVTAPTGCRWKASSDLDWVNIRDSGPGSGTGNVLIEVLENTGRSQRSGQIVVAGNQFTIRQEGASAAELSDVGSLAQIAFGKGWETSMTIFNFHPSPSDAPVELAFFANDGSTPGVPLTSPQHSFPGTLLSPVFGQQINPYGQLILDASESITGHSGTAWAQLRAPAPAGAFAIFKKGGQEAAVPLETRTISSYLMAFDNTGQLATGLAIAHVSSDAFPVNNSVVIRDDTGAKLGTGVISLNPSGHNSFMLTDPTYGFPVTAGKRGTIEFYAPQWKLSVLGLRANGLAFTSLPVFSNSSIGGGTLAHIASGGGWQTLITLVNTGATPAQAQVKFFDNQGNPLNLPLLFPQTGATANESSVSQTLAAGATLLIETQAPAAQVAQVGSAQLTTAGNVSGFAIFRNSGQEAVVPMAPFSPYLQFVVFDNTQGLETGIALANSSSSPAAIPVTLRDETGSFLASTTISLPANGHTSFMLDDRFPMANNIRGSVEFDTPGGGQISALGIRATPAGAYTTIPVITE